MAQSCGTVTVQAPFDPSQVVVTDCSLASSTLQTGQQLAPTASLVNNNAVSVEFDVDFQLDGSTARTEHMILHAGQSGTITAYIDMNTAGTFDVSVTAPYKISRYS